MTFLICLVTSLTTSKYMATKKEYYGKKKQFMFDHWDDITQMRKRMSLSEVSKVYGGYLSRSTIHYYEKIWTI